MLMQRLKCDPIKGMALIALNQVPCGLCRGKLRTRYKLPEGSHAAGCDPEKCTCEGIAERTCLSCYGSGWEAISPDLRGKMFAELAKYKHPQLKQVEHTGEGAPGGQRTQINIVFGIPPAIGQGGANEPPPRQVLQAKKEE